MDVAPQPTPWSDLIILLLLRRLLPLSFLLASQKKNFETVKREERSIGSVLTAVR